MLTPIFIAERFRAKYRIVTTGALAPGGSRLISPNAQYVRAADQQVEPGDISTTPYTVFDVRITNGEEIGGIQAIVAGVPVICKRVFRQIIISGRVYVDAGLDANSRDVQSLLMDDWQTKWGENSGWVFGPAVAMERASSSDVDMTLEYKPRNGRDVPRFRFGIALRVLDTY